jgi:hypothetical protein
MTLSRDASQSDHPKSGAPGLSWAGKYTLLRQIGESALITLAIFVGRIAVVSVINQARKNSSVESGSVAPGPSSPNLMVLRHYTSQVLIRA